MAYDDYSYVFIHNVFGHFIKETMDYFTEYLYPRFEWKVIGTYDKAIEYINKQNEHNHDTAAPIRPGLILNPTGDMNLDENYGKLSFRFPQLAMGLVKYMFNPIYRDENVIVNVGFTRLKGDLEFIALLPSFYEYFDFKIFLLNQCRGLNRKIYPIFFNTFITIPDELYNYEYKNDITGDRYILDWNKYGVYNELLKTTNSTERVYPVKLLPLYTLVNVSDASSRFGGVSNLPDWKLSFSFEYEIDIPSFIVLQSDYMATDLKVDIRVGSAYSINNDSNSDNNEYTEHGVVPTFRHLFNTHMDFSYDSTSPYKIIYPESGTLSNFTHVSLNNRYYHILTEEEVNSIEDIKITIPEEIDDYKFTTVYSKFGQLMTGNDYIIKKNIMTLKAKLLKELAFGDIIEIYIYKGVKDA